jgi:hypothetical protein
MLNQMITSIAILICMNATGQNLEKREMLDVKGLDTLFFSDTIVRIDVAKIELQVVYLPTNGFIGLEGSSDTMQYIYAEKDTFMLFLVEIDGVKISDYGNDTIKNRILKIIETQAERYQSMLNVKQSIDPKKPYFVFFITLDKPEEL